MLPNIPTNDGCGPSLAWWFSADAAATRVRKKEAAAESEFELPSSCTELLRAER